MVVRAQEGGKGTNQCQGRPEGHCNPRRFLAFNGPVRDTGEVEPVTEHGDHGNDDDSVYLYRHGMHYAPFPHNQQPKAISPKSYLLSKLFHTSSNVIFQGTEGFTSEGLSPETGRLSTSSTNLNCRCHNLIASLLEVSAQFSLFPDRKIGTLLCPSAYTSWLCFSVYGSWLADNAYGSVACSLTRAIHILVAPVLLG